MMKDQKGEPTMTTKELTLDEMLEIAEQREKANEDMKDEVVLDETEVKEQK